MKSVAFAVVLLFASSPSPAMADSDGYFCVGPGYVAYEFRGLDQGAARHLLHVVRFSHTGGVTPQTPVELEDFQVHGMRCLDDRVEVAGNTGRHVVVLSSVGTSRIEVKPLGPQAPGESTRNLGHWSQEGVIDLATDGDGGGGGEPGEFQLVIGKVSHPLRGGLEHHTVTRLIQREVRPGGRILASLVLFEGIFLETVD